MAQKKGLANAAYSIILSMIVPANPAMLTRSETIRDVSRALPALVSDPDLDVPAVSAELLDVHMTGLRQRYDNLLPVIDRAGNTLAQAIEKLDPEESADSRGRGRACSGIRRSLLQTPSRGTPPLARCLRRGGCFAFARSLRRARPLGQPVHVDRRHYAGSTLVRPDLRGSPGQCQVPRGSLLYLFVRVARVAP